VKKRRAVAKNGGKHEKGEDENTPFLITLLKDVFSIDL